MICLFCLPQRSQMVSHLPIPLQAPEGDEAGSWYFPGDPMNGAGGRLYCAAMTCLTLEIYYRHLPAWRRKPTNVTK
jgi:hypothetical protein